jgi:hypothetical protein
MQNRSTLYEIQPAVGGCPVLDEIITSASADVIKIVSWRPLRLCGEKDAILPR